MTELGALETVRAIATGQLTAVKACEDAIERIEQRDGPINAVVVRDFERARRDAQAADALAAAGVRKPLLGVPMTVKESLQLAGHPHTWGFAEFRDVKALQDGSTVRRLREAGAVILGKTNVPVALADLQAFNPIYGRTVNPHDHSRTPGGSSGGSAAALAAGMVPLELGSDIGGSIRSPAHFCGVWGHKSTYGVIPLDGHPFPGSDGAAPELAVLGPMARCAADLAVTLDVVSEITLPRPQLNKPDSLRLFVLTEHPRAGAAKVIVDAINTIADKAQAQGVQIIRQSELMPDLAAIAKHWIEMVAIISSAGRTGLDGKPVALTAWFELLDAKARSQRAWQRFFSQFDALLCPVFGQTAFAHTDEADMRKRVLDIDGATVPFGAQFSWITMATFGGLPATSAPIGKDYQGLPFGIQVICDRLQDHKAIALADWLTK